ncbi:MAG: hypothetical protein U0R80_11085 [Nocardioidaceae bacterium]
MSWTRGPARWTPRVLGCLAACGLLLLLGATQLAAPRLALASEPTFTIRSHIFEALPTGSATACQGAPAQLSPGVTRCLVFRLENPQDTAIRVGSVEATLDPAFPPPPESCSAAALSLPTFEGSVLVPARGTATSPGLPIVLRSTGADQNACQDTVFHFRFTGTARFVADTEAESETRPDGQHGSSPDGLPATGSPLSPGRLVGLVAAGGTLLVAGLLLVGIARRRPARADEATGAPPG